MDWLSESLQPIWKKYKIEVTLITAASVISILSILIFLAGNKTDTKVETPKLIRKESLDGPKSNIVVDLSGSIEKSDVYEVSSGARLKDVLILAGGLSQDADREFFSRNFNLARVLKDQEKIYIPSQEEVSESENLPTQVLGQSTDSNGSEALQKVNINSGTLEQLDTLPGIGQVTSQKIVQNRPYQTVNELLSKKAVSKSVYEKIKNLITL